MPEDWALQLWAKAPAAVSEVLSAALAYEEAWAAYTHPKQPFKNRQEEDEVRIHKGLAHQNLMVAIRALKERHG